MVSYLQTVEALVFWRRVTTLVNGQQLAVLEELVAPLKVAESLLSVEVLLVAMQSKISPRVESHRTNFALEIRINHSILVNSLNMLDPCYFRVEFHWAQFALDASFLARSLQLLSWFLVVLLDVFPELGSDVEYQTALVADEILKMFSQVKPECKLVFKLCAACVAF